ncbi:HD domain-containing protein [Candidatus Dojkabacteria bacterium]|uniref:HD domain-containing protein n=1 Tax=Candidatus Dojkabacteria bacterium TaxID=2099670 RepID=A0A955L8J4_9BACT|nr:HD domain-containing protein [Candidatus Dojkabacteria bacterium]
MEKDILKFLYTIEGLKDTLRHNWSKNGRHESVAEHTWRASVFFMIMNDLYDLKVDVVKVFKMILVHDIPELIAGDIPAFIKEGDQEEFEKQEALNSKEVFNLLPSPLNKEYHELYMEFETAETREALVAKAVDRIESQMQHVNSGIEYWEDEEVGEHMLTYPDTIINKLNNEQFGKIWEAVKQELVEMTNLYTKK